MDFGELIRTRRSIRSYDVSRPVPQAVLERVLDAARVAPSACNLQPWHFIVVTDDVQRRKLQAAYRHEWFWTAPCIVVGCVDPGVAWVRRDGKSYAEVDLTIAMDHLVLAAHAEGLGTCWIAAFRDAEAKSALGVPDGVTVVAMTPLGYPASPAPLPGPDRKPLASIVHRDRW